MYAKLELLGSGTDGDDYRVDLPTYNMFEVNYADLWAVVAVGSRQTPPSLPPVGDPLYPLIGTAYVLIGLSQSQLTAWWAKLATQYPHKDPPYMPNFPV